jgi:hypothetical protein
MATQSLVLQSSATIALVLISIAQDYSGAIVSLVLHQNWADQ